MTESPPPENTTPERSANDSPLPAEDAGAGKRSYTFPETSKTADRGRFEQISAFVFGVVFIIVILVIAISFPRPTQFQFIVFKIVLALAAAGVAAVIPGFLNVEVSNIVRAGGAIAVFVIVFFFNPAALIVNEVVPNTKAFHISLSSDQTFEQIVKKAEVSQKPPAIITFNDNCGPFVRSAIVESAGKRLDGNDVVDFIEKLRNKIRNNDQIRYTVKRISEGERYEIICQ